MSHNPRVDLSELSSVLPWTPEQAHALDRQELREAPEQVSGLADDHFRGGSLMRAMNHCRSDLWRALDAQG